jgi:hypothetical protein
MEMNKRAWMIPVMAAVFIALGVWANDAAGQGPVIDDDTRERLKALGYIDDPEDMLMPPDIPPPPPRPGKMREMRPGRGGFGERSDRPFKKKAMEKIKLEDPERYKRIEKIKEYAMEYRETEDEKKKSQIEKELRPLVEKELSVQQEKNKKRIEELEKKLKHMKKVLKQREENWDQVVDHTVKEVTGQNDYLHVLPGGRHRR